MELQVRSTYLNNKGPDPTSGLLYGFFENFNSEKTKIAYKKDLKDFFEFLKANNHSIVVARINIEHAVAYRNFLQRDKNFKDSTINRKVSSCSAFFEYLFKRQIVDKNIFNYVDRRKVGNVTKTRALQDHEVELVLKAWEGETYNDLLYLAVLNVFFYTGIRKAELQSLKIKDLKQYSDFCSLILKTKGGEVVEKKLNNKATEVVIKYLAKRIEDFGNIEEDAGLFVSSLGSGMISAGLIDYIFKKTGEYTGIGSWLTPHVARASFISHLLDKGIPIHKVSKEVGHKDIKTTLGYYNRIQKVENSLVSEVSY